jgi:hypothetical protein
VPALSQSFRINVGAAVAGNATAWQVEDMPLARTMGQAVLLPNGKVVVVNGAQTGRAGGGLLGPGQARDPAYAAVLYDPEAPAGERYAPLAASTIKRLYHSTALRE